MRDDMPKPKHKSHIPEDNFDALFRLVRLRERIGAVVFGTAGFALGVCASYVYWF